MEATFDAKKARISVPATFRNALAAQGSHDIMLRKSDNFPCIEIWPRTQFEAMVQRGAGDLDPFSLEYDELMARLVGDVHQVSLDAEGRVILPRELTTEAGLGAEVVFTGRNLFIQLWDKARYAARRAPKAAP